MNIAITGKTFFSYSFGCRVNQTEKEALDRHLLSLGYQFTDHLPSFYIINTCAVTQKAEREARQLIYRVQKALPRTKIVVTGCAATNWLKKGIKPGNNTLLIDNLEKEYIASMVNNLGDQSKLNQPHFPLASNKYEGSKRMIIKIQDGCQRFCTYCIVPYLRGLPRSRSIAKTITEINQYPQMQEVILTAINTEAYGYDTNVKLVDLLSAILEKTTVSRLSFGSIHPWSLNDDFFRFYRKHISQKRLVNFFHIPLQSGSNKILNLMKRGYTREEFLEKLDYLSRIKPFTFIGTDIIVGFLTETDKDFADTYKFLEKTPISKFHIFRFSVRENTAAFYLSKRLKEPTVAEKQKRAKALAELNIKKYGQFLESHLGNTFTTLFLEKREDDVQHGLLSNQIPIKIRTLKNMKGEIKPVKITDCQNGQLFGRIV